MDERLTSRRRRRPTVGTLRDRWLEIAAYVLFAAADLFLSFWGQPHSVRFNDSATYMTVSFTGSSGRLWFVPLMFRLAGDDTWRVVLQTLVGVACWCLLAEQVARGLVARVGRFAGVAVTLLLALTPEVVQWNRAILSESLAISMSALLLAAGFWFARRPGWWSLGGLCATALAWAFCRQVQALVVVLLAVPLLVLAVRWPGRRALCLTGAVVMVGLAAWGIADSVQPGAISRFNSIAVIRYRAGTDPAELAYLRRHGLPEVAPLRRPIPFARVGLPVNVTEHANSKDMVRLVEDPALATWVDHHWDDVYAGYLLSHPGQALGPPVANAPYLMTGNPDYVQAIELPSWLSDVVYGDTATYLLVLVSLAAVLVILAAVRRRVTPFMAVCLLAVGFDYVWTVAVWNLSASELLRLYEPEAVIAHLILALLVVAAVERLMRRQSADDQVDAEIISTEMASTATSTADSVRRRSPTRDSGPASASGTSNRMAIWSPAR
ncbi:MAG TPA: hypothetical protein VIJ60_03510 [Acidimicrobiales bacterium]